MTLKNNIVEAADPKLDKYVFRLKEPAKRAKKALKDVLEKSVKRFQDQADKAVSDKEKALFLRKTARISNDLEVLQVLSEDEIVRYALIMLNKIMPIASNPRIPREERMKARLAAHKPLSTHLARVKQKLNCEAQEMASESETEQSSSSSSLNKITFNNTIVLMRKDVRRAKVHIIHKLTRNIKKLRMAKGKEQKVVKSQRKAERLHKKVIHIKDLHEDEVSKFALSTTQNLSQLATDIKASTTSQALAMIASHEFVAAHVTDFKSKYPDWQKVVPYLLKKKSKKRKLNLESKGKEKNSGELPTPNIGSESSENDPSEIENDASEMENDPSDIENHISASEKGEESDENEFGEQSESEDIGASQEKNDSEDSDLSAEESDVSENGLPSKVENKSNVIKKPKENKSKVIKKPKENIKIERKVSAKSKTSEKKEEHFEVKPIENKPKVIDPFFVTTTNEKYVTSQVPLSSETNLASGKPECFDPKKAGKFFNLDYKNKWERTGSEGKYGKVNRFQDSAPYKKQSLSSSDKFSTGPRMDKLVFGNRKERRKALHQPQVEEKVEKLHPSWEAKKKQSSIIPFQGKKVTFD